MVLNLLLRGHKEFWLRVERVGCDADWERRLHGLRFRLIHCGQLRRPDVLSANEAFLALLDYSYTPEDAFFLPLPLLELLSRPPLHPLDLPLVRNTLTLLLLGRDDKMIDEAVWHVLASTVIKVNLLVTEVDAGNLLCLNQVNSYLEGLGRNFLLLQVGNAPLERWKSFSFHSVLNHSDSLLDFLVFAGTELFKDLVLLEARSDEVAVHLLLLDVSSGPFLP